MTVKADQDDDGAESGDPECATEYQGVAEDLPVTVDDDETVSVVLHRDHR